VTCHISLHITEKSVPVGGALLPNVCLSHLPKELN